MRLASELFRRLVMYCESLDGFFAGAAASCVGDSFNRGPFRDEECFWAGVIGWRDG